MSSVAGWLCLGGQEVLNEERTRAYLRNCLGDSSWQFFDCDCPPLVAHIVEGGCALVLDGTAGTFASTPDKAAFAITGSIDVRGAFLREGPGPSPGARFLSKWTSAGAGGRSYLTHIHDTVGFQATGSTDGSDVFAFANSGSYAPLYAPELVLVKWEVEPDIGGGERRVTYRTKVPSGGQGLLSQLEDNGGWDLLGTTTFTGAFAFNVSTTPLLFGNSFGENAGFVGRIRAGLLKDGINGTTVASPDFSAQAPGTTSFEDAQGNVWSLNGNAEIACTLDAYGSPATDPAPWYSADHPASEKFFGFLPERSELSVPTSRAVTQRIDGGGVLGPELMLPRNVEFRGWLVAADEEGMRWGIRWMQEVLRGRICAPGCSPGDLSLLTSCADTSYYREMLGAGLVDGPRFDVAVPDNHESVAVPTQFQLAVEMPYLYHDPSEVVSGEVADGTSECVFFTTEEWFDGADLQIEISSEANASDLTLTMAVSLDGTCDEQAQPCAKLTIPLLPAEGKLTIDGRRRQVRFFNPTRRTEEAGYRVVDWIGAFPYFDVAACAQMCICLDNAGLEPVTWTVTKWEREL